MKKHITKFITALLLSSLCTTPVQAQDYQPHLDLDSSNVVVYSRSDHEVLYEKNADEQIYPASMTKMMTVLVALDSGIALDTPVTITYDMLAGLYEQNASVAGFVQGSTVTVEDLLYGVALPSGADACNAIAAVTYGSTEAFVEKMNEKAAEIGMNNTHFMNTTGLHDDNHYTTVQDIAKLLSHGLKNQDFETIFSTPSFTASNGLTFLSTIRKGQSITGYDLPGLVGGKTGFTFQAGHCLASWAKEDNLDLIVVSAGGSGGFYDYTHLMDTNSILQTFSNWSQKTFYEINEEIMTVKLHHAHHKDTEMKVYAPSDISMYVSNDDAVTTLITLPEAVDVTSKPQTITGEIQIYKDDELIGSTPVSVTVEKEKYFLDRIFLFFRNLFS